MNALQHLAVLLEQGTQAASRPLHTGQQLDATLLALQAQVSSGSGTSVSADAQRQALERFWSTRQLASVRDARLVAFGIAVPVTPDGACLLDDSARLLALLKAIDGWRSEPRRFRRCYQGLLRSWFVFDGKSPDAKPAARENWDRLRLWLGDRLAAIATGGPAAQEPDWVVTALASRHLFGSSPAEPYAGQMLLGDSSGLDRVASRLGIAPSSWFMREVLMAQLREATRFGDARFVVVLDRLLGLLGQNALVRDHGIAILLERYAELPEPRVLHRGLYNAAVLCWGNPMLASNLTRWSKVGEAAKSMVADWLKPELISAFFTLFGDESASPGQPQRRAEYWKRYAVAIDELRLGLPEGALARLGEARSDVPLLRQKLEGSTLIVRDKDAAASALLMRFGTVTLVEFGKSEHAVHGYSDSVRLPFDSSQPLATSDPAPNTLRHPSRSLSMQHRDGLQGWATWEQMFEALLKRQYGIEPGVRRVAQSTRHVDLAAADVAAVPELRFDFPVERATDRETPAQAGLSAHWQTAEAGAVEFGRAELAIFARVHSLQVVDNTRSGGNVSVLADDSDDGVSWVLERWGFVYDGLRCWVREEGFRSRPV